MKTARTLTLILLRYYTAIIFIYISNINIANSQTSSPANLPNFLLGYDKISKILTPESPNAASLGRFGDIPVNFNTGIPKIEIPIYDLKGKDLVIPISIAYHSSGNKVEDESSSIGLGWALNAGGIITRQVQDYPDIPDLENPLSGYNNFQLPYYSSLNGFNCDYWKSTALNQSEFRNEINQYDSEPDIFRFEINGKSGSFILDKSTNGAPHTFACRTLDGKNIKAEYDGSSYTWRIILDDGNIYEFAKKERSYLASSRLSQVSATYTESSSPTYSTTFASAYSRALSNLFMGNALSYISAWYLTKIISSKGEVAEFEYHDMSYSNISPYQKLIRLSYKQEFTQVWMAGGCPNINIGGSGYARSFQHGEEHICDIRAYEEVVLKRIILGGIQVEFNVLDREDITSHISQSYQSPFQQVDLRRAKRHSDIRILTFDDGKWSFRKGFKLFHSYFNQNSSYDMYQSLNNYRLKLDAIQEYSGNSDKPKFKFTYNSTPLPPKDTYHKDSWGYYNSNTNSAGVPLSSLLPDGNIACPWEPYCETFTFTMGNRNPDPDHCKAGVLERIEYPTGGYTIFEYEQNRFYRVSGDIYGPGLRIKSIGNYPRADNQYVTTYEYLNTSGRSSGVLLTPINNLNSWKIGYIFCPAGTIGCEWVAPTCSEIMLTVSSDIIARLISSSGAQPLSYSRVKVKEGSGNGFKTYTYNVAEDRQQGLPGPANVIGTYSASGSSAVPFIRDVNCGVLLSESVFNDDGIEQLRTSYEYQPIVDNTRPYSVSAMAGYGAPMYTLQPSTYELVGTESVQSVACYDIPLYWCPISLKATKQFDGSTTLTTSELYTYDNPAHKLITSITTLVNDLPIKRQKFFYPLDFNYQSVPAINLLVNNFQLATPLEVVLERYSSATNAFRVTDAQYMEYATINQTPLAKKLFKLEYMGSGSAATAWPSAILSNTGYRLIEEINYNRELRISELMPTNQPIEGYQWRRNGIYPNAKCIGCKSAGFLFADFEDGTTGSWEAYGQAPDISTQEHRTGKHALKGGALSLPSSFLSTGSKYKLSFWIKSGSVTLYNGSSSTTYTATTTTKNEGWTLINSTIELGGSTLYLTLNNAYVDDISLIPEGCILSTKTMDLINGITSETDPRQSIQNYKYDGLGRLREKIDQDGNVINSNLYRYNRK